MTTLGWRRSCGTALAVLLVLEGLVARVPGEAAPISYVYDDLGRLVGVLDPVGGTAVYRYDAVGNVLSISRVAPTALSVIDFTPRRGPVGATVTITGTGFNATPAQNVVRFNGTPAAVASSSATHIVCTVPVGATTGPISVTVGPASASSGTVFIVTTPSGLPTITGFTPAVGEVGAAVTVTGTNFELLPVDDNVTFNGLGRATVTAATTTTLAAVVPPGVGSGRISVETPAGRAVSADDFFIPPAPYSATAVQATGRLPDGGTLTVTIGTPGMIALVVFDATAGQRATLNMTGVSMTSATVRVYNPAGVGLTAVSVGASGMALNLTLDAPGTHTILIAPDSPSTGSMTLGLATADMIPVTLTAPASVTAQQAVPVTWTVKNQGTAPTGDLWADTLYLSPNPTCCTAASLLGTWNLATPVPAGGSYTMTRTVTIPSVTAGSYYLIVRTDSSGIVYEADEGNNTLASPITVTTPDLAPTAFTTPASASAQQSVSVTWTVKNQGTGPTGDLWADAVYLSPVPTCCSAATLLTTWNLATPVAAGASYTMTRPVTIPDVAAGSYYLIIRTDFSDLVYEADETNNTLARSITVTGAPPDLVPTAVTAPASVSTQQAVSVSWTVKNQGTGSASGLWTDTLYFSPSSTCCVGAIPVASVSVSPGTPAGGSYTQTQTVTIPNVAAGSYYLIIWTDAANTSAETNESNNQLAQALTVTTPDLVPTALTAPILVSSQQAVSVSWTVKNQGTGPAVGPWTDTLYISSSFSCCAGATSLRSVSPAPGTSAGASYSQTQTVTIPSLPVGLYLLFIKVDANATLHEAGETNNVLSRQIFVWR